MAVQTYWAEKTGGGWRPCWTQADGLERRDSPIEADKLAAYKVARAALESHNRERERKAAFRACPMAESFLAVLLQDLQHSESDEACTEEREARDSGTIYTCPDSTFRAAVAECESFLAAIAAHLAAVPDGALAGLDLASCYTLEQMGSDLYLERAGHGAGFRDRDAWSDDRDENAAIGETLSDLVESRSSLEVYLGDDGQAYICGRESA
jgi:hypothetical protein